MFNFFGGGLDLKELLGDSKMISAILNDEFLFKLIFDNLKQISPEKTENINLDDYEILLKKSKKQSIYLIYLVKFNENIVEDTIYIDSLGNFLKSVLDKNKK